MSTFASGDQGLCPGMQKVFWGQKCPGTRGVRDNRRPGTVLAVPGHLASSQDTYAVLGRCCPKTANCPGTGAGVPGPPSWDTRCPGTPCVPGHFFSAPERPPLTPDGTMVVDLDAGSLRLLMSDDTGHCNSIGIAVPCTAYRPSTFSKRVVTLRSL